MKEALDGKLLISILAGVTISQLTAWVPPTTKVVRAMPNTPCRVRASPSTFPFGLTKRPDSRGDDSRQPTPYPLE